MTLGNLRAPRIPNTGGFITISQSNGLALVAEVDARVPGPVAPDAD
jgi:hypothetical protein